MNNPHDNQIDEGIERCEMLSRALARAELNDPYSDETAALAGKLLAAKESLRKVRIAIMTTAADELSGLVVYASVMQPRSE